jgi:drug/metabolite transporter (DMT)-like permease
VKLSGEMLSILSAIFIGISIPIGVVAAKSIGAFQAAVYIPLVSLVFLLAISIATKNKIEIRKMFRDHFKDTISMILSRPIFGDIILLYGFSLTTAIKASFMARLEPVFVAILGYMFLKDKISIRQTSLIFLMISGAFLLSTGGDVKSITQTQIGDILVVIGTLVISYSYIPAKRIGKNIDPLTTTITNNLAGGLILFPVMLILQINPFTINLDNFWIIVARALTFSVLGLSLLFAALKKTKPWIVSSLISLSAVVGAMIGYFFLNESIGTIQIAGAAVILVSSYLMTRSLK